MTKQSKTRQQQIGQQAENSACAHLEKNGLRMVQRNYRCRGGEIDLIMLDSDTLVFIEVRYRRNTSFGSGADSVTVTKQRRITHTAAHFLQTHPHLANRPARFDVVSMKPKDNEFDISWIPNAFVL